MSVNVTVNGSSYTIPQTSETGWGDAVTSWIQAVSSSTFQKSGGIFLLTGEVDFGATFGIKSVYVKSESSNIAAAGVLRLANTDSINFRNIGNTADLALKPSADGILNYNGVDLGTVSLAQTYTNKVMDATANTLSNIGNSSIASNAAIAYSKLSLTASVVNADIAAAAAIAYSKLALGSSIVNSDIAAGAAIAYSKLSLSASIVNADLSPSAAIAYSKLNLTTSIVNSDIATSAAIAYSKLSLSASILNADISGSAAIAYSKLNLSASIVNADIATAAAIAYAKLNLTASILNADISGSAAIALSKLAATTSNRALQSDGSGLVSASATTATELGYVSGVTSAIQTQLNAKQASLPSLTGNGGKYLTNDGVSTLSWGSATTPALSTATKTAAYTLTSTDDVILADATTAAFTLTLPAASGVTGKIFRIKKIDSTTNTVTIARTGSDTFDGVTSKTLTSQYQEWGLLSNGTTWYLIELQAPRSELWLYTCNGYGSTNTAIRRWTTTGKNVGTAHTYTDSATAGMSVTINEAGLYSIDYTDQFSGVGEVGLTLNQVTLTGALDAVPSAQRLKWSQSPGTNLGTTVSTTLFLNVGDVIRTVTSGTASGVNSGQESFRITKVSN